MLRHSHSSFKAPASLHIVQVMHTDADHACVRSVSWRLDEQPYCEWCSSRNCPAHLVSHCSPKLPGLYLLHLIVFYHPISSAASSPPQLFTLVLPFFLQTLPSQMMHPHTTLHAMSARGVRLTCLVRVQLYHSYDHQP